MKVKMAREGSFVEVEAFEVRRVLGDLVFTTVEGRVCARLKVADVEFVNLDDSADFGSVADEEER